jgi:hypothetical protein
LIDRKKIKTMPLEIEGMLPPIHFHFNNRKDLELPSTLLKLFTPKFYSNHGLIYVKKIKKELIDIEKRKD